MQSWFPVGNKQTNDYFFMLKSFKKLKGLKGLKDLKSLKDFKGLTV